MKRLILVGSPRANGRSAHLAREVFESYQRGFADDETEMISILDVNIAPCTGCNACRPEPFVCCEHDDMDDILAKIQQTDELIIVSPVYFASVPSQFKVLIDRLQPTFWARNRKGKKRPASLYIVGDGGDPYGFEPMVATVRSALDCAGFDLVAINNFVGRLNEDGTHIV